MAKQVSAADTYPARQSVEDAKWVLHPSAAELSPAGKPKRLMIGMRPLDHQRSDLFRRLNRPCKHGTPPTEECEECDREDYLLNGFVTGIEDVA
jgi:hypothetical protein